MDLGKEEILLRCRGNMGVEWVACLEMFGQTHKTGNNMKMKQEIDKKRGTRRDDEGDKKETTWEVVVVWLPTSLHLLPPRRPLLPPLLQIPLHHQ
jgi:hypothetical protein